MLVLGVLLLSWLAFRAAGRFVLKPLDSWKTSARCALATMLIFTATPHFTSMRHDFARMVPTWIPEPMAVIYVTGVLELAAAIGILLRQPIRSIAGICLALLLVAMFPANVKAALEGLSIGGNPATALWLRLPIQIFFVGFALWCTHDERAPRHN